VGLERGIIGWCSSRGESLLMGDMGNDGRYDAEIDNLALDSQYYSDNNESFSRSEGGDRSSPYDSPMKSSTSRFGQLKLGITPQLLVVPIRNSSGQVIGVLTAVHHSSSSSSPAEASSSQPIRHHMFETEDCLVLTMLGTFIAQNVEKVAAKRVLMGKSLYETVDWANGSRDA
jgi:hypothetical protein